MPQTNGPNGSPRFCPRHPRVFPLRIAWAVVATALTGQSPLLADVKTWIGTAGSGTGSWDNPDAWSPPGQPRGGDAVFINLPGADVTYANTAFPEAVLSNLQVGAVAGIATLNVGQDTLGTTTLVVGGDTASGAIVHSGGVVNVLTTGAVLGDVAGSFGSYSLSGTARFNVTGQLVVGDIGSGTFTQTGGAVRVPAAGPLPGTLVLASNSTSTGLYTMSGGTLETDLVQLSPFGGVATFNQGGGQVAVAQALALGDVFNPGMVGSATYNHQGGELTARVVSIGTSGTLRHSGGMLRVGGLDIDVTGNPPEGGRLDLTDQSMVIDYDAASPSPIETVRGYLRAGYNGGKWDGIGIVSSAAAVTPERAIGYAEASDVLGLSVGQTASWRGYPVDATTLLLGYTLPGDANVDGVVDFEDLVRLAQHYDQIGTGTWATGDFDYDGNVNFDDLVLLAQNYDTSLPAAGVPGAAAGFEQDLTRATGQVPEPGVTGVTVALVVAARRRGVARGRAKLSLGRNGRR